MDRPLRVALRVVWVALIPMLIGYARVAPRLTTLPRQSIARPAQSGTLLPSSTEPLPPRNFTPAREREDEDEIDLYGNDVSDAVAKYKLDSDGSLYELHSPQTQLPRLGSPRS